MRKFGAVFTYHLSEFSAGEAGVKVLDPKYFFFFFLSSGGAIVHFNYYSVQYGAALKTFLSLEG